MSVQHPKEGREFNQVLSQPGERGAKDSTEVLDPDAHADEGLPLSLVGVDGLDGAWVLSGVCDVSCDRSVGDLCEGGRER